ncbi:aminoglycoside phosphotransferase family protein [Occultella glacieicola]|uniref:Aminoglycoside phosphotransferase family protein n=1 Tax=Occultella glacieicola TaxID=2518684 RepID=A0ABY2E4R1_9MICO|nr:phosphotransferase [Occultella glacieicola]TDE95009.1 aminoglycoside phosphotransferase family protein [Occultella glacieicola]
MRSAERPAIAGAVESLLGKTAVIWRAPEFGLSAADRLIVTFSDGGAAFVKAARTAETAGWLRNEHRFLDHLRGTGLAPEVQGWQDDGTGAPLLVTEDLSAAYWPAAGIEDPGEGTSTLWRPGDIDVLRRTLDRLRRVPIAAELPRTTSWPGPQWQRVIELAGRLADLGVVTPGWLEANAETLTTVDAEADEALELDAHLVHGDLRSDNLCIVGEADEREARLVDWSHAGAGHEWHDLVQLLPTLQLEGGPPPWQVCTEPAPLIARLAGPSLQRACVSTQPDWLRQVFIDLASINLTWLAVVLGLPSPRPDRHPSG